MRGNDDLAPQTKRKRAALLPRTSNIAIILSAAPLFFSSLSFRQGVQSFPRKRESANHITVSSSPRKRESASYNTVPSFPQTWASAKVPFDYHLLALLSFRRISIHL
jgi:hypothetical protein